MIVTRRGVLTAAACLTGAVSFSSSEALPILLRAASRTLTRPFACILCFSAAVTLRTSGFALLSVASPI